MLNIYAYKGKNDTMQKYQDFEFPETTSVGEITSKLMSCGFTFTPFEVLEGIMKLKKSGNEGFAEFTKQNGNELSGLQLSFSK